MGFIKRIISLLYMVLMVVAGLTLIAISFNFISASRIIDAINLVNTAAGGQIAVAVLGAILIVVGILAPIRTAKKTKKSRSITFQNPDGEVTVSISAIEDYVKKVAKDIPDISNVKSRVYFNRKGINIISEVTIKAGSNIPEITERIQLAVKSKVQSMIGVEESINMSLHINKISGDSQMNEPQFQGEEEQTSVPFR